jgi:hypothetical protein
MKSSRQCNAPPIAAPGVLVRCAVLLAAVPVLAGCTPDKPTALATCEKETLRFYSDLGGDDFMIACMEAKGYRFEVLPEDCDGKSRMAKQQACYVPTEWFAALLDGLGRPSKPKSATQTKADPGTAPETPLSR